MLLDGTVVILKRMLFIYISRHEVCLVLTGFVLCINELRRVLTFHLFYVQDNNQNSISQANKARNAI
jgi:hypothetical protein